jgi:hypothetical protein
MGEWRGLQGHETMYAATCVTPSSVLLLSAMHGCIARLLIPAFFVLALLFVEGAAFATQTETHGMYAVPAPGKVTIDGDLSDWDLSGQTLMCYDVEHLKDVRSARVALMYDASNLYVALHWKSPHPMSNCHDPQYQADRGWAGDCVQLRVKTDRIEHLTCWYYGPENEPAITVSHGIGVSQPFGGADEQLFRTTGWKLNKGCEMAFRKDADSMGYVQEIKLPWKVLANKPAYHAGDEFRCGFELLWGGGDWPVHRYADNLSEGSTTREFFFKDVAAWGPVYLMPKGRLHLPPPARIAALAGVGGDRGPVAIHYHLPVNARVTIAINDALGKRVRNVTVAAARLAGDNVEYWDGRDDDGKLASAGKYNFTGIYHDTIHLFYAMSFASPGNPSWETPDGTGAFYGDHTPPEAVAASGKFVALACPLGEAGKHLIGCNLGGQRLWGVANRGGGNAGRVSLATDGKTLWVSEDSTGTIYRLDIANGKLSPWDRSTTDSNGRTYKVLDLAVSKPHVGGQHNLSAIAYGNHMLAACLALDNCVKLLDSSTGDVRSVLKIDSPTAATFNRDGSLIVLSHGMLVHISANGTANLLNDDTYQNGYGLTEDLSGNIYLSVRGTDQNVKVFSQDGKITREIGKRGGRPANGPYEQTGMLYPAQIAIDSLGRLWVTESTDNPKRTSVWTTDGAWTKDLIGSTHYAAAGSINPYDPTMAFSDDTVYKIDLATGSWSPVYSLAPTGEDGDLFPATVDSHSRVVEHNGQTYVYSTSRTGTVVCVTNKGGVWRSCAAVGVVLAKNSPASTVNFESPLLSGHVGDAFAWADLNGDGLVQANELTFAPSDSAKDAGRALMWGYWGQLPSPDGTVTYFNPQSNRLFRLPVAQYSPSGAPVYDVANPIVVNVHGQHIGLNLESYLGGANGVAYLNQSPMTAVDRFGNVLWTYPASLQGGRSHEALAARPGYLIGTSSFAGSADYGSEIGEVFDIDGILGEHYLFTHDGLFVGSLFMDTRGSFTTPTKAVCGMNMDDITAGGECFGANFVRTPGGKTYVTIGSTDARVMEVTGIETIKRFSGTFEFTLQEHAKAQHAVRGNAAKRTAPKLYVVQRMPKRASHFRNIEWPELVDDTLPALEIMQNPEHRYARVAARYDDRCLYVAYRVFSRFDHMRNAGPDYRLLFKTGDLVDLMIGPDPQQGIRGDLRLICSELNGQPIAVLYQKQAPHEPLSEKTAFSSPWRTITFDRVVQESKVRVSCHGLASGYFVEAAIPWAVLGISPRPGLALRADVGVLFADDGGTVTVSRQYWSNKATGLVNDIPGEADLDPELWGTFELER